MGWELFNQYVRAVKEAKPSFFIYENNKSMSAAIRASIDKAFGFEAVHINSALVSAQNRQRLYWVGMRNNDGTYSKVPVDQPEDRCILLKDILDNAVTWLDKSYAYTTRCQGAELKDMLTKHRHTMVAVPVGIGCYPAPDGPMFAEPAEWDGNGNPTKATSHADGKTYLVYRVQNGQITIRGKELPIKLADGFYIFRKLTVAESKRLQTVPEWYEFPVSNAQAYKMLGNGWTVDVIAHILKHIKGEMT